MALLSKRRLLDHDPLVFELSSVQDKHGNCFFRLSFLDNNSERCYAYFTTMSLVLDFVYSNFRY